jgi:hypothetical protein
MRFATRQEIEYLSATDMMADRDASLIDELARRLDALRCYDQHFSRADWRPRSETVGISEATFHTQEQCAEKHISKFETTCACD